MEGRKILHGVYCIVDRSHAAESGTLPFFFLWLSSLAVAYVLYFVGLHTSLKPPLSTSTIVVWLGCLSLVLYRLWLVFVLPIVLPTATCEDKILLGLAVEMYVISTAHLCNIM